MQEVENIFKDLGGEFVSPLSVLTQKLQNIKAYAFDWDGVFNDGTKHQEYGSPFSEVDAMGTNMLRFAHYLVHGEIPQTIIVTGERNQSAQTLATRERFNAFYAKTKDKKVALAHFCSETGIESDQVCFFFDDILDLSMASQVGVRMMANHTGKPMFLNYAKKEGLVDYISANQGGNGAVRETTELLIALMGMYDQVVSNRVAFSGPYAEYLAKRQGQETANYQFQDGEIIQL